MNDEKQGVKISLILPSYGRPQLTERAIRSVFAQGFAPARGDARPTGAGSDGASERTCGAHVLPGVLPTAEVFFFGDGCPVYAELIQQPWFAEARERADWLTVHTRNHEVRDGTPTRIINEAIAECAGEYLLFMANDDRIAPNHFASYYDFAKAKDADLTHTNSTIEMGGDCVGRLAGTLAPPSPRATSIRDTALDYGRIGHAEICVRASLAKSVPPHHRGYGHDWDFIRAVIAASGPDKIWKSPQAPSYFVNMDPARQHVYQNGTA